VVVVVELFAPDQDAPRDDVAARVRRLKGAITPEMANAIDHACREERDPQHLHGPDRRADEAEEHEIDDQHERDAENRVPVV
jgi:hypothetical protein